MRKSPPLKIVARTKSTRTNVASTARYSANPPQTPAMTLFVVLRSRRVDDIRSLPPLSVLVGDREHDRGKGRDRDRRLLRRRDETREWDRGCRHETECETVGVGHELRRDRAERHRDADEERGRGEPRDERRGERGRRKLRTLARPSDERLRVEARRELRRVEAQS